MKIPIPLNQIKKAYFIGVGGSGMSGLAGIFVKRGIQVMGSDQPGCPRFEKLKEDGIDVYESPQPALLDEGVDLVVYSLAIPPHHTEIQKAHSLNIPTLSYPEAVGLLTHTMRTIAISGTHGKSTVTAMLSKVCLENGLDPTVLLGTDLTELRDRNYRSGNGSLFILEACEYKRAFLNYHPSTLLINTLDADHLDYYKNLEDYTDAFIECARRVPLDGYIFANVDDEDVHAVLKRMQELHFPAYNTFTYGAKYAVSDFYLNETTIYKKGTPVGELHLSIPGAHNRMNALAAFSVASTLGLPSQSILASLNAYQGAQRRFELKGTFGKHTLVIDDYGHHPVEVRATLQAARERFPDKKLCLVFQPHQFSRTKMFLEDFKTAFGDADAVIIPSIYEARDTEEDKAAIPAEKLVKELQKNHGDVQFGDGIENTLSLLKKAGAQYDVILTMGAGDVWRVADGLVSL